MLAGASYHCRRLPSGVLPRLFPLPFASHPNATRSTHGTRRVGSSRLGHLVPRLSRASRVPARGELTLARHPPRVYPRARCCWQQDRSVRGESEAWKWDERRQTRVWDRGFRDSALDGQRIESLNFFLLFESLAWYFKILEKSRFSNLFIIDPWVFLLYIFFLQFVIQIPTKLSFSATRTKIKIKKSCKRDFPSKQSPSVLTLSTSLAPIHPTTGWSNTDLHRFSRCQTGGRFAAVTKYADIIALEDLNEKGATSWSVHDFDLD